MIEIELFETLWRLCIMLEIMTENIESQRRQFRSWWRPYVPGAHIR